MGVRRSRSKVEIGLSMDSLLDVFMNVVGVLMITAVVLALSVSQKKQGFATAISQKSNTAPLQSESAAPPKPLILTLPQAEDATTLPLYLLVTGEGIRAANGNDTLIADRYFTSEYNQVTESLVLDPIPGVVMSREELQAWLRSHSPASHHLMAIITPDGARFYKDVRKVVTQEGFRSGWTPHEGPQIVFSSEGNDVRTVQ